VFVAIIAIMRVSIVTATYNEGATVRRTLQSVAEQTHADIEHIVIDGGSTDDTVSLVQAYGDRVSVLMSMSDRGLYHAINRGISVATGDILLCLNSGDRYLECDVISSYVTAFKKFDVDAVFGNLVLTAPEKNGRISRRYRVSGNLQKNLRNGVMPPHPTLAVRRSLHHSLGLYDSTFIIAADFDFFLRLFVVNRVAYHYLDRYLVEMPAGGMSNRSWWTAAENTAEMRRACLQNGVPSGYFRLTSRLISKLAQSQ
jgi:glycosyltransferase involved in cell wall biosynthesis